MHRFAATHAASATAARYSSCGQGLHASLCHAHFHASDLPLIAILLGYLRVIKLMPRLVSRSVFQSGQVLGDVTASRSVVASVSRKLTTETTMYVKISFVHVIVSSLYL